MKVELSDGDIEKIVKALEMHKAYLISQQRDDSAYQELADRLKKKEPQSETQTPDQAKKRG